MPRIVQDDSNQAQVFVQLLGESQYDYDVPDQMLIDLNGAPLPLPARLAEWKLVKFLKEKAVLFAAGDAILLSHMNACVDKLNDTTVGSAQSREMIGEILGTVLPKNMGWRMVMGYGGHGHQGIDQIWAKDDVYLIVECKGGRGNLDQRQRYFEGCTHKGELGMNDDVTQMSTPWVFMGCNDKILGQMFGRTMLSRQQPEERWLLPLNQAAVKICLRLWNPAEFQVRGGALCYRKDFMDNLIAPTRFFNQFFNWTGGELVKLPGVYGIVVKNGERIDAVIYAEPILVLCEETEKRVPTRSFMSGPFKDADSDDSDNGGGGNSNNDPAPHRFKPGIIPQLLNLNY